MLIMDVEICRLCLSKENLCPMFMEQDDNERYSEVLQLTTGLQISANDGLPQQICAECKDLVIKAFKLRNQSKTAEIEHQKRLQQTKLENTSKANLVTQINDQNLYSAETLSTDCFDFDGFKIEIEIDRISQNGDLKNKAKEECNQPIKKESKKEKRLLYLSMVEGHFNPKGPIKCKICKKSVSKWVCFTNHAKKHLGFKVVCEFCGKSFVSTNQLKRHSRSYHGLERDLKCKHCNYLALDKAQLVVHERRVHTGDRPFVCDVCAAAYFSRKCLLQHIESHRTTADVQCDQCQAFFKSRRHLAKHKYTAHSDKRRARRRERRLTQKQENNT